MDLHQHTQQESLGSIGSQLHGMPVPNTATAAAAAAAAAAGASSSSSSSTPLMKGGRTPLVRSGSLLDNLGVQRAGSPFVTSTETALFGLQPQQQASMAVPNHPDSAFGGLHEPLASASASSTSLALDWANGHGQGQGQGQASSFGMAVGSDIAGGGSTSYPVLPVPPPPGVFAPQIQVIDSRWKYIDFQGVIQGPFPSQSMTNWYQAGYLQSSLQITRVATCPEPFGVNDTFTSLGDLMAKVGDFADPFSKFDFIVTQAQVQAQAHAQAQFHAQHPSTEQAASASTPTSRPSLFDGLQLSKDSGLSGPAPTNMAQDAATFLDGTAINLETQDYTHSQLLQVHDSDGGYYHETVSQVPIDKFVESEANKSKILDTASFKTRVKLDQDAVQRRRDHELAAKQKEQQDQTKVVQNSFQSSVPVAHPTAPFRAEPDLNQSVKVETDGIAKQRQRQQEEAERRRLLDESARQQLLKQQQQEIEEQEQQQQRIAREQQEAEERMKREELEKLRRESATPNASAPAPALLSAKPAPWANKGKPAFSGPSLADVQQKEAAQRAKRKQEQEQQTRELAAKLQQQVLIEESTKPRIDSIASWASKKKSASTQEQLKAPVKTIEQIQKEQLEEKKFLAEQKRLWEEVQRNAKLNVPSSINETNEWTTVTKKQPVPVKAINGVKSIKQSSAYLNPEKLRSMSANSSKQIGSSTSIPTLKAKAVAKPPATTAGNVSTSLRQEFLKWCKAQMKLSPDVDVNGVLEVLFSLPAGPESKEIIADTVYSNSSSMDGRRFATEFIKRRAECESKLTDSLSWSEALSLPEGDAEDWEFQVVGKKKNRKH
ncbi:LAME_0D09142g1_1 [Lachancea meyersii CBS 8951]|uniref:LAME_0D09142g1_1 n=1 Tax=Lachancea meyersii CBS 8951 TaxID=1266667 RepID=A0A1G4JB67_9SACH|nr:LAME_0D09142g1_1 [Lachancea meyersii CBS 8951]